MVRVVQVIEFFNVYGLHGLKNQVIEKTCGVTPVTPMTYKLTNWHGKVEQHSAKAEFAIRVI